MSAFMMQRSNSERPLASLPGAEVQRGLGIIEVLVALLVVSFGVLGMVGLQLTGMKQSTNGFNRTKATLLVEDMASRMRVNRDAATVGLYGGYDSSSADFACSTKPDPYCQAHPGGSADDCTVGELVEFDMFSVACGDFNSSDADGGVKNVMPTGAQMTVTCDTSPCDPGSSHTIVLTWSESQNASSDTADLSSVRMRIRP